MLLYMLYVVIHTTTIGFKFVILSDNETPFFDNSGTKVQYRRLWKVTVPLSFQTLSVL